MTKVETFDNELKNTEYYTSVGFMFSWLMTICLIVGYVLIGNLTTIEIKMINGLVLMLITPVALFMFVGMAIDLVIMLEKQRNNKIVFRKRVGRYEEKK